MNHRLSNDAARCAGDFPTSEYVVPLSVAQTLERNCTALQEAADSLALALRNDGIEINNELSAMVRLAALAQYDELTP